MFLLADKKCLPVNAFICSFFHRRYCLFILILTHLLLSHSYLFKVSIAGAREADIGLANVLLSDIIATGTYVSFKESSGGSAMPTPGMRNSRDMLGGTDVQYDSRIRSDSINSSGPDLSSLSFLNPTRDVLGDRERERYLNNSSMNNYEFRHQYPGSQAEIEREREKERAALAGRFNSTASLPGPLNAPGVQPPTSRYPRLFPSASGGIGIPGPSSRSPTGVSNPQIPGRFQVPGQGQNQGQGQGQGQSLSQGLGQGGLPMRPPFDRERERGYDFDNNRGYDNGPNSLLGDSEDGADALRADSLNRAIERANISSGVKLGEVMCPADKIVHVIGTKGVIINEISRKSNTVISIVDEDARGPNSPFGNIPKSQRLILIRGSEDGVDMARRYIAAVLASGPACLTGESQMAGSSAYLKAPGSSGLGLGPSPGGYSSSYGISGQSSSLLSQQSQQGQLRGLNDGILSGLGGLEGSRDRSSMNPSSLSSIDYDSSMAIAAVERERERERSSLALSSADYLEGDRERTPPSTRLGPPGLNPNPLSNSATPEETNQYWSSYGGTDNGRMAPPPHLSFTDMKNAGIRNGNDVGGTAPDPTSRRSMARFQTYLDRTHAQQSTAPPPSLNQSAPTVRGPQGLVQERERERDRERERGHDRERDRGSNNNRTMTLIEVLDTLTCPLEKIPMLLGHNGKYVISEK